MSIHKLLVIGGSGFIGARATRTWQRSHGPVRLVDRYAPPADLLAGESDYVEADLRGEALPASVLADVDAVLYLAHIGFPAGAMNDLAEEFEANVLPLTRFLEQLRHARANRSFVYLSSGGAVYGEPETRAPLREAHPCRPLSGYGLSKAAGEHCVRVSARGGGFGATVLRPGNAYGPGQRTDRPQGAVAHFLKSAAERTSLTLYAGGEVVRDYVYIDDLVEAILAALDRPPAAGACALYNVGTGVGISLNELVDKVEATTGERLATRPAPARACDCAYNVLDNARIRAELGWQARTPLDEGLARTWARLQQEHRFAPRA